MNIEELDSWRSEEEERIFDEYSKIVQTTKEPRNKFEVQYLAQIKKLRADYEKKYNKITHPGKLKISIEKIKKKFIKKE